MTNDPRDEYEFYGELEHMSLAEYNHMRCVQDYGLTKEDRESGDEDY